MKLPSVPAGMFSSARLEHRQQTLTLLNRARYVCYASISDRVSPRPRCSIPAFCGSYRLRVTCINTDFCREARFTQEMIRDRENSAGKLSGRRSGYLWRERDRDFRGPAGATRGCRFPPIGTTPLPVRMARAGNAKRTIPPFVGFVGFVTKCCNVFAEPNRRKRNKQGPGAISEVAQVLMLSLRVRQELPAGIMCRLPSWGHGGRKAA